MAEILLRDPSESGEILLQEPPRMTGIERVGRSVVDTLSDTASTVGGAAMNFMRGYPKAVDRIAAVNVEGLNRGMAALLDMPIGIVNSVLRFAGLPPASDPERGFRSLFNQLGVTGKVDPQDLSERVMMRIAEEIGVAGPMAALAPAAGVAVTASRVPQIAQFLRDVAKDPGGFMKRELAMAAQSGAGAAGAREVGSGDLGEAAAQIGTPLAIQAGRAGLSGIAGALNLGKEAQERYVAGRMMGASQAPTPQALAHEIDVGAGMYREPGIGQTEPLIPGFNPTVAQSVPTGPMQGLERRITTNVAGVEQLNDRLAAQAEAVRQAMGFNDPRLMEEAAGRTIRGDVTAHLKDLERARSREADPLFAAARATNATVIPAKALSRLVDELKTAKGDEAKAIEQAIRAFNVYGTPNIDTSINGLMSTRSVLTRMTSDPDVPGHAKRVIGSALEDLDTELSAASPEFARGIEAYRRRSEPINLMGRPVKEGGAGEVTEKAPETGKFKMPESDIPETFVGTGKAQPESFGALLRSVGSRSKAITAAKTILQQNMQKSITGAGERVTSQKLGNYLRENESLVKGAFGEDHFQNLRQIRNLLKRAEVSTRPVTPQSPTAYLQAQKTEQTVFMKLWTAIRQGAERVGQLKPLSAKAIARRAARGEVESSGIQADMLLRDALLDPQFAKALLSRVGSREAEAAMPRMRAYLTNLGGEEE